MRRSSPDPRQHAFDTGKAEPTRLSANGRHLEIGLGQRRRRWARVGYWLLFLTAGLLFVALFERLTGSRAVAIVSVAFMIGYMQLAAHLTTKALRQAPGSSGLG